MTDPRNGGVKTLGVKLAPALHAQFALVAQLDGNSLADAVCKAVEFYVAHKRSQSDFAERAKAVLEEIEREAAGRRGAIEALFGSEAVDSAGETKPASNPKATSRRRGGEVGA